MKQINDLIICTVPKDGKNHRIADEKWVRYDPDGFVMLNSGQYEIIGLYSEACIDWTVLLRVAVTGDVDTKDSLNDFLQKNDIPIPTDTTDLLFIHKLK